jgi:hypothetical protein
MSRLTTLGAFAALVTLTGWAAPSARADHPSKHFDECAKVCADCQVECDKNFHHCFKLVEDGKKEHAKAARLSADCAEVCALSAKLTARKSELALPGCEACAKACAAECEKFKDVPEMKACAEACKKCAASCREMVKMVGHDHGHEKK